MHDERPAPAGGAAFERRLATILMADIVGYSRMMEADEERTLRIFHGHREIFDALLAQHRGRIFNTAGDAVLAEFPSAVDAVRCATEIQSALRTRNDLLAEGDRMQFRIGINLGDVIVQGRDLLGDGVNVAARIQTAAEPGGVAISGSVYDQIRNKLSLDFRAMGERTFKNISQPVRVFSIDDGGASSARVTATSAPPAAASPAPVKPPPRRPLALLAAGAIGLAIATLAGWWYVQDREAKAVEAARAAEAARTAEKLQAEAARRKAEDEAAKRAAAEREAKLRAEVDVAQREAAEAKKRADAMRATLAPAAVAKPAAPATTPPALTAAAPTAPPSAASPATTPAPTPVAPTPSPAVPAASAAVAPATFPHDGDYRGRACWELPGSGKAPLCWSFNLAVERNRINASWVGSYGGGKASHFRGQLTPQGSVQAIFDGFTTQGLPISGDVSGQVIEGRMTLESMLPNRVRISGTATRVR